MPTSHPDSGLTFEQTRILAKLTGRLVGNVVPLSESSTDSIWKQRRIKHGIVLLTTRIGPLYYVNVMRDADKLRLLPLEHLWPVRSVSKICDDFDWTVNDKVGRLLNSEYGSDDFTLGLNYVIALMRRHRKTV